MPGEQTPRVSVIIPAYNQARYLKQAIDSVLAQTYRDFEIIVVDDGSTDDTAAIAAAYGGQIHYIYQENRGLAGARNTGIRAAQGELIGLLDSDDIWLPNYLKAMVKLANQYPTAVVYFCQARCIDVEGNDLPQIVGGKEFIPEALLSEMLLSNFIIPSTVTLRRSVVVDVGLFDASLRSCEDWDMWLRLLPEHEFAFTNEILVRYRVHESSLSANPTGMQQAKRSVVEKHYGLDDGDFATWSQEKRLAYGGLYRYYLLTSVQRQQNWQSGVDYLSRALLIDPSLAEDTSLFYELAVSSQPLGYRNVLEELDLEPNAKRIINLLESVFVKTGDSRLNSLKRKTYGTFYYALGLAAYNSGKLSISRSFFLKALWYRPGHFCSRLLMGNLVKSFLGNTLLSKVRQFRIVRLQ